MSDAEKAPKRYRVTGDCVFYAHDDQHAMLMLAMFLYDTATGVTNDLLTQGEIYIRPAPMVTTEEFPKVH